MDKLKSSVNFVQLSGKVDILNIYEKNRDTSYSAHTHTHTHTHITFATPIITRSLYVCKYKLV